MLSRHWGGVRLHNVAYDQPSFVRKTVCRQHCSWLWAIIGFADVEWPHKDCRLRSQQLNKVRTKDGHRLRYTVVHLAGAGAHTIPRFGVLPAWDTEPYHWIRSSVSLVHAMNICVCSWVLSSLYDYASKIEETLLFPFWCCHTLVCIQEGRLFSLSLAESRAEYTRPAT